MDAVDLQLALGRLHGLNAAKLRAIYDAVSPAQSEPRSLANLVNASPALKTLLHAVDPTRIGEDRRLIKTEGVHLLDLWHSDYPTQLAKLPHAPVLLYVQGDVASLASRQVAMAGSRRPSFLGRRTARSFAARLAEAGLTITSGLAEGIDAASHEGAVSAGGRSIAVLGTGIDQI